MKIETGRSYLKPDGSVVTIGGPTKRFPDSFAWSIQGDWYTWDGERVGYAIVHDDKGREVGGKHVVIPGPYLRDMEQTNE